MTTEVVDMITVVVDGFEVSVPKGTLVIRAAEQLGIQIPRFCDHPLLDPVGACRQSIDDIVKTTPGLSYDRPTDDNFNIFWNLI